MEVNFTFDRPEEGPKSGPITVGWFLTSDKAAVLFDPPERVLFRQTNKTHSKSASRCPAVIQMESRYFLVKCPYDLSLIHISTPCAIRNWQWPPETSSIR